MFHVDTVGSNYDTVLAVWTGTWGSLTNVGCHDDISWPGNPQSTLDVAVTSGTTYYVEVAGYYLSSSGNLTLSADLISAPANDDFDNAFTISSTPYTYAQDASLATTAADDPVISCGGPSVHSHSVWYDYTPTASGTLSVDTVGSDYDTVLAVWSGPRGSLTEEACDDDGGPGQLSSLSLDVVAGTTYHIEVVAYDSTSGGNLTLNAGFVAGNPVKTLYFHNLAAPVTIVNGSSTAEILDRQQVWGGEATVTFDNSPTYFSYLYPGLQRDLGLQGTVRISLYIEADNNQNSNVTVSLIDLAPGGSTTTIGSDTVAVPRDSDGWYTFSIASVNYTIAQGHAVVIGMQTANPSQDVTLHYDSATYNSRVDLPVTTYVDVENVQPISSCHPEGSITFSQGQGMTVTARISDPFGSYDIAGATVRIADPGGTPVVPGAAMTPMVTATDAITYGYSYAIPSGAALGLYTVVVTGTESNGLVDTGSFVFTVQSPVTLSASLSAAPLAADVGDPITVTMAVTNSGQADAQNVTPSTLTLGGTGSAVLVSGPTPPSADISGGGTASFTWVYSGTATGTVNWTGSASGSDVNSCTPVSSAPAISNDVQVIPDLRMEVGTVSGVGESWVTVNLGNTYTDMVVVCTINNDSSSPPLVTRVRNAAGSSFQVRLQRPSGGTQTTRTVRYLVIEAGAYTLPDGRRIEAQKYTSTVTDGYNASWVGQQQTYLQTYTNPVVVGQVMSADDPAEDWSVFWARGSSAGNPPDASNLWTGKHVSKDTDTTRVDETVGFVVIEQGYGDIYGVEYEAWLGTDSVEGVDNSPPYPYTFQRAFGSTPQVALVSQAAEDGGQGGFAILYGSNPLRSTGIDLAIDEDLSGGTDRTHTTEQVAYLVFARPFVLGDRPFLYLSKEALEAGGLLLPGDTLVYTVDYANYGLMPATAVSLTDTLPAETLFGSASLGCIHDGSPTDGLVTCPIGTLNPGDFGTVTITVTVDPGLTANATLTNTVFISSAEGAGNTAYAYTPVTAFSLLKLETLTTTVGSAWITVTLSNTYNDMVVVCTPNYDNTSSPLVPRVRNASGSSFELRLQNPGDGSPVTTSPVHCIVIEAGAWTLPDGRKIEAQKYTSTVTDYATGSWVGEQQTYLQSYTNPVVVGQVMSGNDDRWSVFWARGSSSTNPPDAGNLWTGKAVCEDSDRSRADEVVGFIVIEQGNGTLGPMAYEAWLGAGTILGVSDAPPYSYSFNQPFGSSPQVALASKMAVDGNNGGWAILYGASPLDVASIRLAIDEDQIGDSERSHTSEQVAYLVFEGLVVIRPTHSLYISKIDAPDPVAPSSNLVYTLTYVNTGPLTVTNVIITETYDTNVNFVSASPLPDVGDNVWQVGTLGPGESGTIVITVTVDSGLPDRTILSNAVTIDSDQTEPFTYVALTTFAAPPVYLIEARAGPVTIRVLVRLSGSRLEILSWEVLRQ
jgi:uncharacterized repeat protein (TIGR01451 family)